jgi:hypothetical protein
MVDLLMSRSGNLTNVLFCKITDSLSGVNISSEVMKVRHDRTLFSARPYEVEQVDDGKGPVRQASCSGSCHKKK